MKKFFVLSFVLLLSAGFFAYNLFANEPCIGGCCTSTVDCYDENSGDATDPYTGEDLCCYAYAGWQGQARD